jgi:hypothetical protein
MLHISPAKEFVLCIMQLGMSRRKEGIMSRRHLGVALFAVAVMLVLALAGPASANYLPVRNSDEFKHSDHLQFQHVENGGKTLEWWFKDGHWDRHIGISFTGWAATLPLGDHHNVIETNHVSATPIPNAAWLLGSGVLALIGLKRRNRKNVR